MPLLKAVRCVPAPEKQCTLSGEKLFLLDSVSADADFVNPVTVPEGFVEDALAIPPPKTRRYTSSCAMIPQRRYGRAAGTATATIAPGTTND